MPWGLWIGFDMLCGIALAAGGYTLASAVYVFGLERYHAIVRPAVLTGFLGYLFAVLGL
jgi:Ni/Fe-hydrogenase subunit HybB-like protein